MSWQLCAALSANAVAPHEQGRTFGMIDTVSIPGYSSIVYNIVGWYHGTMNSAPV